MTLSRRDMRGRRRLRRKTKRELFELRITRTRKLEEWGFTFLEADWIAGLQVPIYPRRTGRSKQTPARLFASSLIQRWKKRRKKDLKNLKFDRLSPQQIVSFFEENENDSIELMRDEYGADLGVKDEAYDEHVVD